MLKWALPSSLLVVLTAVDAFAETRVTTEAELQQAVANAQPGAVITLADGTYTLTSRLAPSTGGTSASPITVQAEHAYAAIIDTNANEEAFQMSVPWWSFSGLHIRVQGGSAHAFKLDTSGQNIAIRNSKMELISPAEAAIKGSGGPTAPQPDNAVIEGNEIWFTAPTNSVNSEGIDAVAVVGWIIRGNLIHDIHKDNVTQDGIAYGAFTKGNSQNTIIENNVFYNCFISISLGGGGTDPQYFRDGDTTYEERNGIIRNNMTINSNDVAIYLNQAHNARIYNNTFFQSFKNCASCSSIDVRFSGSTADIRNNILDKPINDRDSGSHTASSNMMLPTPTDSSWFVDAAHYNLRLHAGVPPIDQGETLALVPADIDGVMRPVGPAYDIGAQEWSSTPPPPHDGGAPPIDASMHADASPPMDAQANPGMDASVNATPDGGVPGRDASLGIDAGARADAAAGADAAHADGSQTKAASGGCGCTETHARDSFGGVALGLVALLSVICRRARARDFD
jgi:hypothetical protein